MLDTHSSINPIIHQSVFFVEIAQLAQVLVALGCPADKSVEMAAQLDKRAKQLAAEKGRSYEEALKHLLTLMKQGWAAKEKGF
ncbi:MAG TPA: hypothetical protein VGO57_14730 [Verrucomicrobiae bacterium]|jgi:hypothetical protein